MSVFLGQNDLFMLRVGFCLLLGIFLLLIGIFVKLYLDHNDLKEILSTMPRCKEEPEGDKE